MLATLSLVIRHEALARRGETIYRKAPTQEMGWGFVLLLFVIYKSPADNPQGSGSLSSRRKKMKKIIAGYHQ